MNQVQEKKRKFQGENVLNVCFVLIERQEVFILRFHVGMKFERFRKSMIHSAG